jgi:hypothetical protein
MDSEIEKIGDLIVTVMSEIRRDKAEKKKPLNTPIKELIFYSVENKKSMNVLLNAKEDLSGTLKIKQMKLEAGKRKGLEIKGIKDLFYEIKY